MFRFGTRRSGGRYTRSRARSPFVPCRTSPQRHGDPQRSLSQLLGALEAAGRRGGVGVRVLRLAPALCAVSQ